MEHVEVLREMLDDAAIEPPWEPEEVAAITAAIASLSAQQSDDWVLVPREPTPEMLSAAGRLQACECGFVGDMSPMDGEEYAAMLAAAPQPPAEAQPVACDEDRFEQFLQAAIARSPEPLRELGEYLAGVLDDDQWPAADRLLLQLATSTPSAPVGVEGRAREAVALALDEAGHPTEANNVRSGIDLGEYRVELSAARIALAQQPAAVDEVISAARAVAKEYDGPLEAIIYDSDDDEAGDRVCCRVRSYKPHAEGCPLIRLRAALAAQQGGES